MDIATGLKKVRRFVASLSLVTMMASMLIVSVANAASYSDVPSDAWFYTYVEQLAAADILDTTQSKYRPGDVANRAEAAKLLVEAAGLTIDTSAGPSFKDVAAGAWYYQYVETAVKNGIVGGYQDGAGNLTGKFGPGDMVTREQFAKMAVNAMSLAENTDGGPHFSDVMESGWSYGFVETMYNWSAVDGYPDGSFGPAKTINRAEISKMVVGAMNPVERNPMTFDVSGATAKTTSTVEVMFSMAVDKTLGADAKNFMIVDKDNKELAVSAAVVDNNKVTLTTALQVEKAAYSLTAKNLKSADGKDMVKATASFTGYSASAPAPVGGSLSVVKGSETPSLTTLATKTANNTMLVLEFSGSAATPSQVTGVKLMKAGIYNDSSVKVVAYDANGNRISTGVTFSDGVATVTFYNPLSVSGSTVKVWLKVSISGTASGTLGVKIADAASVMSNSTGLSASFPIESPVHNVVDGTSSVAAATIDVTSISATTRNVDIGEKAYELTKFKISETSSKEDVKLMSLTLFNNGSVADGDIKNFTLVDQSGTTVATTVDQASKLVKFDLSKAPYVFPKGAERTFRVLIDVMNGATRTTQLIVQNDFDLELVGSSTGASILPTATTGGTDTSFPIGDIATTVAGYNHITINEGTLTVAKANTSPSGDITVGATDATLGVFELKAAGEDIELQRIKIDLSSNNNTLDATADATGTMECTAAACDITGSVKLMVDENLDGKGDKTLLSTSANPTTLGDLWDQDATANYDLSSFFTVAAGKTVHLMLVASLSSTNVGSGETIRVGIKDVYAYKKASLKYATSAATVVQGNQMTATASSLTVSTNTAYGAQNIVPQSGVKIASFIVKAGSGEGVDITSVTVKGGTTCGGAGDVSGYTNVLLKKGSTGTQLGSTKATVTFDGGGTGDTSNTFSLSGFSLVAGAQEVLDVYGDMSSSATNLCVTIPIAGISGTGKISTTSVTGPAAALNTQLITATANGNLTVAVANSTPVSQIFTAGSTDKQVLLVQASASNAEDIYIKKITFRTDAAADDVAIQSATLKTGSDPAALTQVGETLGWNDDGSNPGFVEWTFSGASRPKVLKNGTLYAALYVTFASSSEQTVTNKTPLFNLGNLEAEGTSTISASGAATGTLINNSGIIVSSSASITTGTYATSTDTIGAAVTTASATSITTTLASSAGDILFIDEDAGADWDPATEELMVVVLDAGATLTVQRGAFGTTAQSAYTNGRTIYSLNGVVANVNGVAGNAMTTFNTKPTFAVAGSSPSGSTTGGTTKEIFHFNVTADANAVDGGQNKVILTSVDITTTKSGLTVANLTINPLTQINNDTYKTTCNALSATKWRCTMDTDGGFNEILEGATTTYVVKADVVSGAGATNTLDVSIASIGTSALAGGSSALTAGDMVWTDNVTSGINWAYQAVSNIKPANPLTLGVTSGGTADAAFLTTALTIGVASSGGADNSIDAGDIITITFPEMIDPTSINASLVPGGSTVTGVLASATGGLTAADTAIVTIVGITTFDSGTDLGGNTASFTTNLALDLTGKILTITLNTGTARAIGTPAAGSGTSIAATVKDVNGNAMGANATGTMVQSGGGTAF